MDASVVLDYLISRNTGNTLYFNEKDKTFHSILKEAILRGFQVTSLFLPNSFSEGFGYGNGAFCFGYSMPICQGIFDGGGHEGRRETFGCGYSLGRSCIFQDEASKEYQYPFMPLYYLS